MKPKQWLVPALIGVGIIVILISVFGPKSTSRNVISENELGFLNEKTGSVYVQNYEMPEPVILKSNFSLHPKDAIRTEAGSDALIEFKNEGQFRISEKAEVLLDITDSGAPVVIVKTGDIFIEKFGRAPSFWVRKDGQSLSALDFALLDKRNAPRLKEPIPLPEESTTLSQTDIESVMNAKKSDFFKCYGQTLQKNPQARGQILIAFKIEKNGQTSKIEISKSDIPDTSFKTCLLEVVARTQFKQFTGAPIHTIFPLKFE